MARFRTIEEMYADSAPESLIDPITHSVFCKPVVSPCSGRTYSEKTVIEFGMKDPYSMETIPMLIPNRDKQEELEKFYQDKFKETVGNLIDKSIDQNVEDIVELVAMVVDRSDLQVCLNGQRLLIELIQSSTNDQLGRFKARLSLAGLGMVAKLVEKQNATILKGRLGIDISSLANAMLLPPQPVPSLPFPPVPYATSTASIHDSDDEEEYDFSDTDSVISSVSCADDKTYVFVDRMPPKTTVKGVKQHFGKFKDSMIGRVWFIKGSNGTKARLTFKTSESALEAIELMNKSYFPNSSTPILVKLWVDKKRKQKTEPETTKPNTPRKKSASESLVGEPVATADVYVGNNLPPSVTEDDIKMHFKMFEPHIQKLVLITVKDPKTKQSKRFAKVTFVSLQAAQVAVEKLNKTQLPQSKYRLVVNIWGKSKKETDRVPTSPTKSIPEEDAKSWVGEPVAATDVYVGNNLPPNVTENDIKLHFKKFEPHIQRVLLIKDSKTKQSKGFAKVTFISLQAAQMAVEKLNNTQLPQSKQRLVVNIWKPKKETDEVPASPTKSIPEENTKDTEKKSKQRRKQKGAGEQVAMAPDLEDKPKEELIGLTIENVSVQISGDQLKQMLEGFGDVKRYSIISAPTGKTVYKAEVYFSSREEADDTISHLNGNQLAGEKILVQYIKSTKKMSVETFGVYVGKIPKALHKPEFEQIFAKYGKVSSVYFNSDKNFGYVNYFSMEDASAALDMNNREVYGSKLRVNMASKKTMETPVEANLSHSLSVPAPTPVPEPPSFVSLPGKRKESSPGKPASYTVQIRNLSPRTMKEQLTTLVECYGSLTCPVHLVPGDPPYAYVNYATAEAANAACTYLHGQELDGKTIRVKLKEDKDGATPVSPSVPLTASTIPPFVTTVTPQSPYPPAMPSIPLQPQIPPPIGSTPHYPLPSTVKLRRASAQFNKFLHERMDLKLREFASFGGLVRWNSDLLTVKASSEAALNQFEIEVLNVLDEDKVVLSSEDWNKLMLMRPDKTSLFQQLVLPYRTNPNVYIESQDAALTICIVGMRDAVKDVKITIMSELNKEITVEEVKMMTLLQLEPMLREQSQQNFGAIMEGFFLGSTKINFTGNSQSVSKAREWFVSLLGQYKVLNCQCQAALIPSALDRFTTDSLSVVLCVKCNNGTICYAAQYTASHTMEVLLLVCGREPVVQRAMDVFTHPDESIVVFTSMEILQNVKSQSMYNFSQLSQQHRVYIHESSTPTVAVRGYMKDRIAMVESILNQAKVNLERCTVTLPGSKMKMACLTKALAQQPDQARAFFMTVFQLTSVEILRTDQTMRLTGPADKINLAEKMIEDSEFLKGYHNQSFEFESQSNFMNQTKKYLSKKFNQQHLNVEVNCTMNKAKKKGRKPSQGDWNQINDTFNVCIESENVQHFGLACQIVKELKPESRFIRMSKRDFDCLSQAVKNKALDIEGVYCVRFDLQDKNKTVAIHGLTGAEINAAENEIRAFLNANVPIKLSVKVTKHQKYFLAEKCAHLQETCIIHYPKASDFKKEDQGELIQAAITLQGDRSHVEVTKQKIDEILSRLSFTCIQQRHEEYGYMWKRRWEEIKRQQEETYNGVLVITHYGLDEKGTKKPKDIGVSVEMTVTSDDFYTVCQVDQNIKNVPTTLMQQSILVSMDQCKSVAEGLKSKKLLLRGNHNVEIEIDWNKKNLILLAPQGSEDFETAFATLTAFVQGETMCKESLGLGEPGMSPFIHQKQRWSEIIDVAKKCSVRVKHNNDDLEVFGKAPNIAQARGQLAELLQRFRMFLDTQEISVPTLLESVLKTLEFQNLVAKLRQNYCIVVTFRNIQRNMKMVTLYKATVKPEGCDRPCIIEVCHGNMVDETTDVIVNAANSQLQHAGGLAKAISDAGGPVIQQTSNDYVRQYGVVKPGHVACLPSGNLSCSVVMHAVGPIWKDGGPNKANELYAAVSASLLDSDTHGYRSISIPAISAGIYGCPVEDCAEISIKAITDLLNGNCLKSISHVRFVLFTWDAANAFKAAFKDCLQKNKNFRTSSHIVDQPSGTRVQWYWEDDSKKLQPYSSEDSLKLSQAYAASPHQSFQITIQRHKYRIDFAQMLQTNIGTNKQRRVYRKSLGVVIWYYKDDEGKWAPYTSDRSDLLEVMYETRNMQPLQIGQWAYSFDFDNMLQTNTSTNNRRSIRRYVSQSSGNANERSVSRQTSANAKVSLNGPRQFLSKAADEVNAHFKKCLTTKEVSLPASVSNSVRNQMICLGQKYNVQAEYVQQMQKMKFHGVTESVTKAVLAAQDILLDVGNMSNIEVPREWEPQTDNVAIKEVTIGCPEWKRVAQLVLNTLPQVDVLKIERIQNRSLWEKYVFHARRMKEKNKGNLSERELFHGTSGTLPEKIYADEEEGFDMRFSRRGLWGQGNYFAERASYSDNYAYQDPNGTKQFFLAKVLTGDSTELKSDEKLRMPPLKNDGTTRYDTVNGITHGCRVYIAYSNDKAYPLYLITYMYLLIQF